MSPRFRRDLWMKMIRVLDLAAVCVTFLAALVIGSGSWTWPSFVYVLAIRVKVANLLLFMGYIALCSAVFSACGLYRSHRLSCWNQRLYEILLAVTWVTGALLLLKWALHLSFATNAFLLLFWLLTLCTLWLLHELALQLLQLARARGRNLRNVVIVGEGAEITDLVNHMRQEASLGYRILRTIDAEELMKNDQIISDR